MKHETVLFSEMVPEPDWEDEFNSWYDTEHIPIRMKVPGFIGAQRYRNVSGPGYLAVYDLRSRDVLTTDAYRQIKDNPSALSARMLGSVSGFTRNIGVLTSLQENTGLRGDAVQAPILYAVFFNVPNDRQDEFDAWYTQDHVPLLLNCSDWSAVKRYRLFDAHPEPFTHLAIHYLQSQSALDSKERKQARETAWRGRLSKEDWFKGTYKVFAKAGTRFQPGEVN